ncbi:hypothetical protein [Desnuesiella massiliensis]|uniref:hypothetical protein n=1 Tax=Desnuesiella massiliensis TaxID=1650662 RepID=UPI0006E2D14F|nr:hypothetical protein [Desnuesiella massiliensis]
MSSSKRLFFSLSEALKEDNKKKSQFIKQAVILYIEEKKKLEYIENMKKGYAEMGTINLEFSEMSSAYDLKECLEYETWLSESDLPNDDYNSEKRRYILC